MAEDPYHREGHACEVAEGVSHKDFRGEFIVLQKAQGHKDEGDDDGQREDVLGYLLRSRPEVDLLFDFR